MKLDLNIPFKLNFFKVWYPFIFTSLLNSAFYKLRTDKIGRNEDNLDLPLGGGGGIVITYYLYNIENSHQNTVQYIGWGGYNKPLVKVYI